MEVSLKISAVAFPILPGKTDEWREFARDLNGPRQEAFAESRRKAGVRERSFLQSTPMGDMVIVTLEGDDPERSFGQMLGETDSFTVWFLERVKALHGVDLSTSTHGSPSELVIDSERVPATV